MSRVTNSDFVAARLPCIGLTSSGRGRLERSHSAETICPSCRVGLIYQPNSAMRLDLIMPRPRFSCLLAENGPRQQWGYVGAGLNGTTWGVERADRSDDQLTYGDFRLVLGWESTPAKEPGIPFTRGKKLGAELGYVFSRDFEWERDSSKLKLDEALMLRASMSF